MKHRLRLLIHSSRVITRSHLTCSPRFVVYGYEGLLMHPVNPPSLDYMFGLEEPEQAPLSPDYVPGPEYPEYLAPSDEEVPIEDQPYAAADSPIALSLCYGDADDEYDEEAFEEDRDEEEEEEHLPPADSIVVASIVVDPVPSAEETKPFETDESVVTPSPPPVYRTTARMSIRAQTLIPFPSL
ncbi:hypothetical protein Tco_0869257, partial [Tanacetum coccineum]